MACKMIALSLVVTTTLFLEITGSSIFAFDVQGGNAISNPDLLANISNGMPDIAFFPVPKDVNDETTLDSFYIGLKGLAFYRHDLAESQFVRIQGVKPLFGMAYWGQAMCQMKWLWGEKNSNKACQILKKIETLKAVVTSNNTFYVEAANTLFGCNNDLTEADRLKKYAEILKGGIAKYPDNLLIKTYYAQALMEMSATYSSPEMVEARGIINRVLVKNPTHPLAMHLLIRSLDTAELASLALPLASVLPKVAYGPSIAPHLAAHIYIRLGLWKQAAQSDKEAVKRVEDFNKKYKDNSLSFDADNHFRALEFFHYELLQLGDYKEAKRLLNKMITVTSELNSPKYLQWCYKMAAHQWLETSLFNKDVLGAVPPFTDNTLASANAESGYLLAYALSLLKSLDPDKITKVEGVISRLAKISSNVKPLSAFVSKSTEVMQYELLAQLEVSRGQASKDSYAKAFAIMEKAIQIEGSMVASPRDPILPFSPSFEFFGGLILRSETKDQKWLDKAITCFQRSLQKHPKRSLSLLGLGRALKVRGESQKSAAVYQELNEHWKPVLP